MTEKCISFDEPEYEDDLDRYELAKKKVKHLNVNEGLDLVTNDENREICGEEMYLRKVVKLMYYDGRELLNDARSKIKRDLGLEVKR